MGLAGQWVGISASLSAEHRVVMARSEYGAISMIVDRVERPVALAPAGKETVLTGAGFCSACEHTLYAAGRLLGIRVRIDWVVGGEAQVLHSAIASTSRSAPKRTGSVHRSWVSRATLLRACQAESSLRYAVLGAIAATREG